MKRKTLEKLDQTRPEQLDRVEIADYGILGPTCGAFVYAHIAAKGPQQSRVRHFAVNYQAVVRLDYTPFEVMPETVFQWFVKLDFPRRDDLKRCSQFSDIATVSPLTKFDVERIWIWRRMQELASKQQTRA